MSGTLRSGILVTPKLESFLREERNNPNSKISIIKVKVVDSTLDLDSFIEGSLPCSMKSFQENIDTKIACFYFIHVSIDQWCFVSWIPDGSIKIKERMIYASSKQQLKDTFGQKFILSDHHFTSLSDLRISGDYLVRVLGSSNQPNKGTNQLANRMKNLRVTGEERKSLLSKVELAREEAREQEDTAREEIAKALLNKSTKNSSPLSSFNSGGFHQVNIPLLESSKEALNRLAEGEVAWVEIAVTDKKDGLEPLNILTYDQLNFWDKNTQLPLAKNNDPRFYITVLGDQFPPKPPAKFSSVNTEVKRHTSLPLENKLREQNDDEQEEDNKNEEENEEKEDVENEEGGDKVETQSPQEGEIEAGEESETKVEEPEEIDSQPRLRSDLTFVIVYSCPQKSPPRLRMVYSTTVSQLISQIQQEGVPLNYKIEQFDEIPERLAKYKYLYDKILGKENGGVFKLDKAPSLSYLVQSSHQQHLDDVKRNKELDAIRPRMAKGPAASSGPHPLFGGVALPAMTNNPNREHSM